MIHVFGEYELDERLYEVRRGGRPIKVEPKVFDMLACLIRLRERVVSRDELLSILWPGEHVGDAALSSCIRDARKAVGDDGDRQAVIKTIHGRGYRFVAPVAPKAGEPRPPRSTGPRGQPEVAGGRSAGAVFVGRESALLQLRGALDDAIGGRGRIILISGEPGIGKTRTAEELAALAGERGAEVLGGRWYEAPAAPAFWPWIQIIRGYIAAREVAEIENVMGTAAVDLARVVPELARRLPDLGEPPQLDSEQARFRFFDSLTTFLRNAAKVRPLVLLLDDLHWADTPSLLALRFLGREMGEMRLVVVATFRDEEVGRQHPVALATADLQRLEWSERISLAGLSAAEVREFIEKNSGLEPVPGLVSAVYEKTEGNPFFVTEIVCLLERGKASGSPEKNASPSLPIPKTTREAITRRLDQLPPRCEEALAAASVLGREFDLSALGRMLAGREERSSGKRSGRTPSLQGLLDAAERARVIEPMPDASGRYRFCHVLIRDTLYEALAAGARAGMHRLAGTALEELHRGNLEPYFDTLAYHFGQSAGDDELRKAVDYSAHAGERATAVYAYEEGARHYRRALDLLDSIAPESQKLPARRPSARTRGQRRRSGALPAHGARRCELLLALGENQWRSGDVPQARETFLEAAAAARRGRWPARLARAALGFGGGFRGFDLGVVEPALIEFLEEALARRASLPPMLAARLLARLAVALYHVPDSLTRRRTLSREAVTAAERSGDIAAHLAALYSRHWAIWGPDNLDDRLRAATAMVRQSERASDNEMALHAHRFRLIDLLEMGDLAGVHEEMAHCERLAAALRQPYYDWYVAYFRAMLAILSSRFEDGARFAAEALAFGQRAQSQNAVHQYGVQAFVLSRELGRLQDIEPNVRAMVSQYPTVPAWRGALAYIHTELNRPESAREELDRLAAGEFRDLPRDTFWFGAVVLTSDACASLGDAERAAALYDLLAPYADRNVVLGVGGSCLGSVARNLGRLAATVGRKRDATRHFEDALTMTERLGSRHLVAHTQRDYAEFVLSHGDAEQAGRLADRSLATYTTLGMTSFAARARELRERINRAPKRSKVPIRLIR